MFRISRSSLSLLPAYQSFYPTSLSFILITSSSHILYIMYLSNIFVTALAATTTVHAFDITKEANSVSAHTKRTWMSVLNLVNSMFNRPGQSAACPAVWSEISTALTAQFLADGQCTGE